MEKTWKPTICWAKSGWNLNSSDEWCRKPHTVVQPDSIDSNGTPQKNWHEKAKFHGACRMPPNDTGGPGPSRHSSPDPNWWCDTLANDRITPGQMGLSENSVPRKTQWFCWSLSLLNGYFIGGIPHFQTYPNEKTGHGSTVFGAKLGGTRFNRRVDVDFFVVSQKVASWILECLFC